jgi:hypothetical protein
LHGISLLAFAIDVSRFGEIRPVGLT